jgi:hypothetical protein
MKILFIVACFLFCYTANAAHAKLGDRHYEKAGGFSLQAPKGWQFHEQPGTKYQTAFGPPSNSFWPNIFILDEAYQGTLKGLVDANQTLLPKMFKQFTINKRDTFVTARGLRGERLVTTSLQQKILLRQILYIIPGVNGKYFVVNCTALAAGGEALDSVCEESIKTFDLIK